MLGVMRWLFFSALSLYFAHGRILWGTATAAYQVEGYRSIDGRQPSIWDAFDTENVSTLIKSKKPNGKFNIFDGESAEKADEDYKLYRDSVHLIKEIGFGAARLSISWPRVMTFSRDEVDGSLKFERNPEGIAHYKDVLMEYKRHGIQTAVTMFHWDLPLAIEEFASSQSCHSAWLCHDLIPELFAEYAELLLSEYSNLTDWWITINEPLTIVANGYSGSGAHAPGRCSNRNFCYDGDDRTEPYAAAKGMILAHARAFRVWKRFGQPGRGCGITLNGDFRIPFTDVDADRAAAQRSMEFQAPLFADPIHFGRWPASIETRVGARLPKWTDDEIKLVNGTHDGHFFMNTYSSNFARASNETGTSCGFQCDPGAETSGYNFTSRAPIGTPSSNGWLFNYGPGLGKLTQWYHERYPGVSFVITENGWGNASSTEEAELGPDDSERCNYYRDYIGNLSAIAAEHEIQIDAYFAWSLMDNYEWADGFSVRFGLTYVNFTTGQRIPKKSARWFQKHIVMLSRLPVDGKPLPACSDVTTSGTRLGPLHTSSTIVYA